MPGLHDIIVLGGIIWWIVASVMRAAKSAKSGSSTSENPLLTSLPTVQRPKRQQQAVQPASGYAGRNMRERNPDQSRAMTSAAPRLAEGAEYGPIVAEREADAAAERRFADQAKLLIASEPTAVQASARRRQVRPVEAENNFDLFPGLILNNSADTSLVRAIILAEVIGPPVSKKNRIRQIRT